MSADRQPKGWRSRHGHKKTSGRSVSGSTTVCLPNMTARADAFAPPTATFPLHDVTDCFRTRHDRPNLTVLADHCRGKRSLQIAARHPSGRQPLSRRQVPREWWSQTGSNRRPHACKARALPAELCPLTMVGLGRLERPTSPLSGVRSNHLSYRPKQIEDNT